MSRTVTRTGLELLKPSSMVGEPWEAVPGNNEIMPKERGRYFSGRYWQSDSNGDIQPLASGGGLTVPAIGDTEWQTT